MECEIILVKKPGSVCSFCYRTEDECDQLFVGVTGKCMCNHCIPVIKEEMTKPPVEEIENVYGS